ncbi:PLC-like phosphodiesterase [Lipomyces arxii]|uniref:PLC-like phosphodiesterase n=1 Tax=Lipomyces arxii TaxID=56418 RepID=UPI0034CF7F72
MATRNIKTWMAELPDEILLSLLSIPGTHNSAACYKALPSVRCQKVSVSTQLEHGIRFIDLRTSRSVIALCSHTLVIVHGSFPVSLRRRVLLDSVLNEIYQFLDTHSSETVVLSVKHEGPYSQDKYELAEILWNEYIVPNKDKWWVVNGKMPSLGEARGKIVLFRRFACHQSNVYGFPATSWPYNTTGNYSPTLAIQDMCDILTPSLIPAKADFIRRHLVLASTSSSESTLFVNFTTASNFWDYRCWPKRVAKAIYPDLVAGVENVTGRCGIVVMDFAESDGWSIVKKIVNKNQVNYFFRIVRVFVLVLVLVLCVLCVEIRPVLCVLCVLLIDPTLTVLVGLDATDFEI